MSLHKPDLTVVMGLEKPHHDGDGSHDEDGGGVDHGKAILDAIKKGDPLALKDALKECVLEIMAEEEDRDGEPSEGGDKLSKKPSLEEALGGDGY